MRSDDGKLIWFKSNQYSLFAPTPAYFTNNLIWLHKYIEIYNIMENKKSEWRVMGEILK